MALAWNILRVLLVAAIVVTVAELSKRYPRAGALLLSLPTVSILAITFGWLQHHDLPAISRLARETLILVALGLPFFVPLAFAQRLGLGFWPALVAGVVLASFTIVSWVFLAPGNLRGA
jgi:hypothetical protein